MAKYNITEKKEKEALLKPTADSVAFVNHSNDGDFDIPLKWQSKGTIKYIRILDALYDMITSSHVYYLDELGEDLHNDLLYYYLNVFLFNSEKSQLITTTQVLAPRPTTSTNAFVSPEISFCFCALLRPPFSFVIETEITGIFVLLKIYLYFSFKS